MTRLVATGKQMTTHRRRQGGHRFDKLAVKNRAISSELLLVTPAWLLQCGAHLNPTG